VTRLELDNVSVAYDGARAVTELSLEVPTGAWVGLVGPNGAGKTTFLRATAGLVKCSGEVRLDERRLASMSRRQIARLVAFVPQRPVIPESMAVDDYVLLGRTPYVSYLGAETRRDLEVVRDVLARLDLTPLRARVLGSLSGGEMQRVLLARALAQQASLLLLDEPTAALDVGHQQHVLELVDTLRREHGLTVLSAMHDLTLAGQFADSLVLMSAGRAAAWGPARTVLTESLIREHYGASVRVLETPGGGVLVIPLRPARGRLGGSAEQPGPLGGTGERPGRAATARETATS
jgi:cobalamin transport system ATP-binding protein